MPRDAGPCIHVPLHQMILTFYQMYLLIFLVNQNMVRIQMCVSLLQESHGNLSLPTETPGKMFQHTGKGDAGRP